MDTTRIILAILNSNTTNVKVKPTPALSTEAIMLYSNTTNVKVKRYLRTEAQNINMSFKYNQC